MPRHPPYGLKRLIYAQKIIFFCEKLNFYMIVLLFEQSDIDILIVHLIRTIRIDIIIYNLKKLKVSVWWRIAGSNR